MSLMLGGKKKLVNTAVAKQPVTILKRLGANQKILSTTLDPSFEEVKDGMTLASRKQDAYEIYIDRSAAQNGREYMEDYDIIVRDPQTGIIICIVCDGHGTDKVSKILIYVFANRILPILAHAQTMELQLRQLLQKNVEKRKAFIHRHWLLVERKLKEECLKIDELLYAHFREQISKELTPGGKRFEEELKERVDRVGGSTLVSLAILPWIKRFVIINVGDSHLVLSDKDGHCQFNTFEAKPTHEMEKKRIEKAKGFVKGKRVNGNLALSRAFMDAMLKISPNTGKYHPNEGPVTVDATVEIFHYDDNIKWAYLVSDGITDVMTDKEGLKWIESFHKKKIRPADAIVKKAHELASKDNLTAIVLLFVPKTNK